MAKKKRKGDKGKGAEKAGPAKRTDRAEAPAESVRSAPGPAGSGTPRALLGRIDRRLAELDAELQAAEELVIERRRLASARAALTGERSGGGSLARRLTREELAAHLRAHPGRGAAEIARDLGVPATNISQHLHRGRDTLFERRADGWHVRA